MGIRDSIEIGGLELRNRLVMPPMASEKSDDGYVTDGLCRYYTDRTKSGKIGLVITEHCYIAKQGKASSGQLSIADDGCIEGLKKLTDCIHKSGTKVFAQINHAGGGTNSEITGEEIVAPSSVLNFSKVRAKELPRELTKEEIKNLVTLYAAAAIRAKKSGYDGVEIHSAHGYMLNQFYSPLLNKRTDEYGACCVGDRVRIHLEVIKAVRDAVGDDYPVGIRLGGCDYQEGGSTIEDAVAACVLFEMEGVDFIDISGGTCGYMVPGREKAVFADTAREVMKAVTVPVILTGGISSGEEADSLIKGAFADMIGVGRAMLKDPDWAAKEM